MMRRKARKMVSHERFSMNVLGPAFIASATITTSPLASGATTDTLGRPDSGSTSSSFGFHAYLRHSRDQKNSLKSS